MISALHKGRDWYKTYTLIDMQTLDTMDFVLDIPEARLKDVKTYVFAITSLLLLLFARISHESMPGGKGITQFVCSII